MSATVNLRKFNRELSNNGFSENFRHNLCKNRKSNFLIFIYDILKTFRNFFAVEKICLNAKVIEKSRIPKILFQFFV